MEKKTIFSQKYIVTNKLLLLIGGIGFALFITTSIMFYILPLSKFSPVWWSELRAFLFCLLVILGGFFRVRFLLIIIILFAPLSIFYGTWAITEAVRELPLHFFDMINSLIGILNIFLSLIAFLGLFFWWKESSQNNHKI